MSQENSREDTYFLISEVLFSLLFAILVSVLLYNHFGFRWEKKLSLVLRWSAIVVVWGWTMVLTLYVVNRLNQKWRHKINWIAELVLSLIMGGGLIYFLVLVFR